MLAPKVALAVNGKRYSGWKTARITRSIESISGSFELGLSERWANQSKPWPIREGDECAVLIDGVAVITGFIDKREIEFDANSHTVSVSGRDRTGDLVDSSALLDKWEFKNISVLALAEKLCDPHRVSVALQPGLTLPAATLPKKYSIDPGDTVANALENLCRVAGVLPVADGAGGLELVRASADRCTTELVEGKNILRARATFDGSGRFNEYLALGSHKGRDDLYAANAAAIKGSAKDESVRPSRILVIRPEGNVTPAQATDRAQWEATTRAARGDTFTVTVQGWKQADGQLWPVNRVVRLRSPMLDFAGDLLIAQVSYSLDVNSGTTTQLELRARDAFKPQAVIQPNTGNNYWPEIVKGV
jgi:prophage tail gpP-like protein